jgi:uncharacterized protein
MNDLFTLLTEQEMKSLDRFLLDRIHEDVDTQGKEEGILDISELDGFFTAVVSGPVVTPPSQWFPAVWGDFEPVWGSEQEFEKIFTLMMRHMNGIAGTLMTHPDDFEPVFLEGEVKGRTHTIVDEWCEGYRRGLELAKDDWDSAGRDLVVLLTPIYAFTPETKWRGHDFSVDEMERIQNAIAPNVREIHAYWLARRGNEPPPIASPENRSGPKVGRNEPCPCGSGKKYKKCCLH